MSSLDVDLAGLLRLRLVDPSETDVASVTRHLGAKAATTIESATPPDLTIRFVDRLSERYERARRVGPGDVRWLDSELAVARGSGRSERWAILPFDQIGGSCEILAERGIPSVPFLTSVINLTLVARGVLPLHASAFVANGIGIAAAGWSQSGKTEAMLGFMARDARLVADEWTYVHPDREMVGLRTPVRLEPWHLAQRPDLLDRLDRAERRRLARLGVVRRTRGLAQRSVGRLPGGRVVTRGLSIILSGDHADVHPDALFGPDRRATDARLEVVFWMVPGFGTGIEVTDADATDVVARMAVAHLHHRRTLLDAYWRFRYAFPDRRNPLIDDVESRERELLSAILSGCRVFRVDHPKPVDLERLALAMASCLPAGVPA